MAKKYWIKGALRHHKKGALHRSLHVPMGEDIPLKKLRAAAKKGGKLGQRARFALRARGFHHHHGPVAKRRRRHSVRHKKTR